MATGGEAKVREGDKLIMEAEKCLKTNWLKWSAEYAGAAHAFDKAGKTSCQILREDNLYQSTPLV
jgi:hypothetical protein